MVYHTMLLLQRKYRIISSGQKSPCLSFCVKKWQDTEDIVFHTFILYTKLILYKIFVSRIRTLLQLLSQLNDVLNHTSEGRTVLYILLRYYYTNLATEIFYSSLKHTKLDSYRPVQCLYVFCGQRPDSWDSGDSHRPVPYLCVLWRKTRLLRFREKTKISLLYFPLTFMYNFFSLFCSIIFKTVVNKRV